ncbi:MAG TPA: cytochrome c4 [Chromatiaceae bacterium]|nr:cytochrome c4 [Chromatiaceae bacterium]
MANKTKKLALLVGGIALGLGSIAHAADAPKPAAAPAPAAAAPAAAAPAAPPAALVSGATAEALANTCAGCHGTGGVSSGPASPTLAGTNPEYFNDIMKRYADGSAYSTIMGRIAKGFTTEEIALMADYFAKAPFAPAKQKFDAVLVKEGGTIHEKVCEKCHSEGGKVLAAAPADKKPADKKAKKDEDEDDDEGGGDEWHILAGQWTPYLKYTIEDYVAERREMPKKMKKAIEKVTAKDADTGLAALLAYYASQQ